MLLVMRLLILIPRSLKYCGSIKKIENYKDSRNDRDNVFQ